MAWIRPLQGGIGGGGGGGGGGSDTGTIRIPFGLATVNGTFSLPAGARVFEVRTEIDVAYPPGTTIDVGAPSSPAAYMPTADILVTLPGTYHIPVDIVALAEVVRVTVGGAPGVGSGVAVLEYSTPSV